MTALHIKGKLFYLSISNGIGGLNATEGEQEIEKITEKLIYCKIKKWPENRTHRKDEMDTLIRTWAGYEVIYTDRNRRNDYVIEIFKRLKADQENRVNQECLRLKAIKKVLRKLINNESVGLQSIHIGIEND